MVFLADRCSRENYIFIVFVTCIFFASYWTTQLGFTDCLILVLPRVSSIFQILAFSTIFIIILPLLNTFTYYQQIVFYTKLDYKSVSSRVFVYIIRASFLLLIIYGFLQHCLSLILTLFMALFIVGRLFEEIFQIQLSQDLVRTNGKIDYINIIGVIFLSIMLGAAYANYITTSYSASILAAPNIPLKYLGNISGEYVIKTSGKILFIGDVYLSRLASSKKN